MPRASSFHASSSRARSIAFCSDTAAARCAGRRAKVEHLTDRRRDVVDVLDDDAQILRARALLTSRSTCSARPRITASGLPISCAISVDSTPTVISFSARTSWFSRSRAAATARA